MALTRSKAQPKTVAPRLSYAQIESENNTPFEQTGRTCLCPPLSSAMDRRVLKIQYSQDTPKALTLKKRC